MFKGTWPKTSILERLSKPLLCAVSARDDKISCGTFLLELIAIAAKSINSAVITNLLPTPKDKALIFVC